MLRKMIQFENWENLVILWLFIKPLHNTNINSIQRVNDISNWT